MWLFEAVACLPAEPRFQLFAIALSMDSHIMRCDITADGSCKSAATSGVVERL